MSHELEGTVGRDIYEDIADEYASIIDSKDANAFYEKPVTLGMMPNVSGMRVLDAGCGPGVYSEWLLDHGAEVIGIDYSEKMVTLAKARAYGRGTFHVADLAERLDFLSNAEFDMIVSPLTLDYIRDWVPTLQKFNRTLKDRGILLFSCQHPCFSSYLANLENYFIVQKVEETWGSEFNKRFLMPRFHRSLSSIFSTLSGSGFEVRKVVEPQPTRYIM